ncbi:hypothetical protein BO79DRAFT_226709 [Aspergillus costaricaensis CBS 115574]|uniref:Uncharacterized protein n=1 Tax=Aspergillus costaricaensis CBS 115574 TaxID=1448317 RepID=A0ACD1IKU9_9EURO|nr:hypothetical protein BO79DRAFT_226709 [Aspergillus costaricaensis CBS 115574]RAK90950.1 hypothetical protein BO79DRAFT_226709 [Aspergillus costaricaensis CBS 115574]
MLSTVSRVRRGLDKLFDKVMELRRYVPTDGHVNIHNLKCVEHVIRFDFEQLDNPETCSTIFPPVFFRPMESNQLRKSYPEIRGFANIDQFIGKLSPKFRCSQIASLIHDRATREVMIHQELQFVQAPDSTFWLETGLTCPYGKGRDWWSVSRVLEPEPRPVDGQAYPHLAIHLIDTKEAREDSILFSEFSALVFAMRGRANQRKVDSETEKWRLMENDGEGTEEYPYLFPNEEYFPVLLFSFVLPQHARILTACIVQEKLVSRQSKLYSFEWKKSAPIDFFLRLYLSRPLETRG